MRKVGVVERFWRMEGVFYAKSCGGKWDLASGIPVARLRGLLKADRCAVHNFFCAIPSLMQAELATVCHSTKNG